MGVSSGMMPAVIPSKALIHVVGTRHWWPENMCCQRQIIRGKAVPCIKLEEVRRTRVHGDIGRTETFFGRKLLCKE